MEANPEATIWPSIWCLVEPCCKVCVTSLYQQCRSFVNSTEARPVICGKTIHDIAHALPFNTLSAYLDDVHIICYPERVSTIHAILQEELWRHSWIQIHHGKMQVWNLSGNRPVGCDVLDRAARALDPEFTTVWRGGGEPAHQGIMILGTPLGHVDFVRAQLEHIVDEHNVLLERIPSLPDVQSTWALLLHCANA